MLRMDCYGKDRSKRSKNFTDIEKVILVNLIEPHIEIVENKLTNATFNKIKSDCWNEIAISYNCNQTSGERTGMQLKSLFKQIKRTARMNKSMNQADELDERVIQLMNKISLHSDNTIDSCDDSLPPLNSSLTSLSDTNRVSPAFIKIGNNFNEIRTEIKIEPDPIRPEDIAEVLTNDNSNDNACSSNEKADSRIVKSRRVWGSERRRLVTSRSRNALYRKRIELMEVMKEVELENLRGKRIENETRIIVKEKEALELRMKRLQYLGMLKEKGLDSS